MGGAASGIGPDPSDMSLCVGTDDGRLCMEPGSGAAAEMVSRSVAAKAGCINGII